MKSSDSEEVPVAWVVFEITEGGRVHRRLFDTVTKAKEWALMNITLCTEITYSPPSRSKYYCGKAYVIEGVLKET